MNKKISTSLGLSLLIATNIYSADKLDTITVTSATKSSQSIKDVTSSIEVITSEELEERQFTDLTQALNSVAGISFTSNGGLGQTSFVRINGAHYSNVLVLIDGIRYNDITNGSAFPQNILITDIKQIEIIKGAQSGIWGADASAGVINIITKDSEDGFHGTINTEYGSYNTKKYGASVSFKEDNYYAKLNAQRVISDGFSAQATRGVDLDSLEDDSYKNTTLSLKTGFNIDDANKIDLSHTIIDSESEYDGSDANDSDDKIISKSKFSKINFNHNDSINKLDIYASKSSFDRVDPTGYTNEFTGDIKEYGIKSNIEYNNSDFIVLGIDRKEFTQKKSYAIDYSNTGYFLSNSNKFNDDTIFTQSLRYDKYTSFKNKVTGKIGLKHSFNDFEFSTNYGTGYKAPSLYELSHDGGNDLNPEATKSFDISGKYKDLKVRLFRNKIDDLLTYITDHYENTDGTSVLKGYELNYNKNIEEDTLLSLTYTYTSAKDKDGERLLRVANRNLKFGLDYYGIGKLHLNVNGEYIGNRKDVGNTQTGNYTVWNSVMNYEINKTFSTYLKVDNLFNKYYQTIDGYATAERSAYVGLKATF